MKLSGTVKWDLSHLPQADRELIEGKPGSKKRRSVERNWMTFGNNRWTEVRERDGRFSFEVEGVRPGKMKVSSWRRGLQWQSAEMMVTRDAVNVLVVMRPEAGQLKRFLAARRPKSKKKKPAKK